MRGKNFERNLVLWSVVAGLVLLFLVVGIGDFKFLVIDTQQLTKSISYVHQFSNKVDLNNDLFKILLQVGIGTDEIIASIDNTEFNRALIEEGFKSASTETDISFSSNIQKETVKYRLIPGQGTGEVFTVYSVQSQTDPGLWGDPPSCTYNSANERIIFDRDFTYGDRFCIIEKDFGRFGNIGLDSIQTDIAYELRKGGQIATSGILSNMGTNSGLKELRDNTGKFIGRLRISQVSQSAGAFPPNPSSYRGTYIFGKGWQLNNFQDVDDYKSVRSSLLTSRVPTLKSSEQNIFLKECWNLFSSDKTNTCLRAKLKEAISPVQVNVYTVQTRLASLSNGNTQISGLTESNGFIYYYPTASKLTNPETLLELQASWVGIRILVSEPRIDNVECPAFTQNGAIKVKVINTGQVTSNFGVKLNSCNNIQQSSETLEKSISDGSSTEFIIPIQSNGNAFTSTCSVSAFNVELPDSTRKTDTVSCQSKAIGVCTEGDQKLTTQGGQDCVLQCGTNGQYGSSPILCCDKGVEPVVKSGKVIYQCIQSSNKEICDNKIDDDNDGKVDKDDSDCESGSKCKWYDIPCLFNQLNNLLTIIKYIVLVIASLISLFYSQRVVQNLIKAKQPYPSWIIAVLIAGAIGVASYSVLATNLFWYLVAGTIFVFLFLNFTPIGRVVKKFR